MKAKDIITIEGVLQYLVELEEDLEDAGFIKQVREPEIDPVKELSKLTKAQLIEKLLG